MDECVAIVGTGKPRSAKAEDESGWGMAHHHATGYQRVDGCRIVACVDIVEEHAAAFAESHEIPEEQVYTDHARMLQAVDPDVVSVCTPPPTHADIVVDCATSGVDAVHCEKPMAATWGDARRMALACWRRDVQLTFDHQRRFGPTVREAKAILDTGEIGELERIVVGGGNLFDWGTHVVDIAGLFADEADPEWVLAAVDAGDPTDVFGVPHENQGLMQWQYANGVDGVAFVGENAGFDELVRVEGADGTIDISSARAPTLSMHTPDGIEERSVAEVESYENWYSLVYEGVAEAMSAHREGRESEIGAAAALRTTEVLFGAYESVRRQGRVEFPLTVDDHPLASMLAARDSETP